MDDVGLFNANNISLSCAVLIGGTDAELEAARAMRAAGVRVFPIGTTGAAAKMALEEAVLDESWGLTPTDCLVLSRDTVYAVLFEKILSS